MSTRDWKFRVEDILEAIGRIEEYTASADFQNWQQNQMAVDAVIRNLEVIGEAASQIPMEIQEKFPEIPWIKMRGIRNILIHEYFGVDLEVVWNTVKEDLPGLKKLLSETVKGL